MLKKGKNGIKYRPIGDEFDFFGETLRVERCVSADVPCTGCFFEHNATCHKIRVRGTCLKVFRPDGKDVIFAKKGGEKC